MKNYLIIIIIAFCSCSRERDISIDFPFEPKIVVYGYLGNESGSTIKVFNSAPVGEINPQYPSLNTKAFLYENGNLVDTFVRNNEDILLSYHKIHTTDEYIVELVDGETTLKSGVVLLPQPNVIENYSFEIDSISNSVIVTLSFSKPYNQSDEIHAYSNSSDLVSLSYSTEITGDRKKIFLDFDYRYPVLGPSNQILRIDTLDYLDLRFKYFSYEKARFAQYRSEISSQVGGSSNQHTPPWTNVENAYGFVTSYICDSILLDL